MIGIRSATAASIHFRQSAQLFAERADSLDDSGHHGQLDSAGQTALEQELRSMALGAVLTSTSLVEALLNELFLERSLFDPPHWFPGTPREVSAALLDAWDDGVEWYGVITKAQIAAVLAGKPRIDFGRGAAQRLKLMIALRNALVHAKPRWTKSGHLSDDELEQKLRSSFEPARIWQGRGREFRWWGCLGGPCAAWAYETAIGFRAEFCAHLGIGFPGPP